MHGLATIRRLNGEPRLSDEDLAAASRAAAARPLTAEQIAEKRAATETKPETV